MFHNKSLVEEMSDQVVIRDISVTNETNQLTNVLLIILIKDMKKTKLWIKEHGAINTDEKKWIN